jgi:prepilin-type processing-associated H-X9-DG protein
MNETNSGGAQKESLHKARSLTPPQLGLAAIICAAAVVAVVVWILVNSRARQEKYREVSMQNLLQIGLAFKVYAARDPENLWPPLSAQPAQLAVEANAIYPEYISNAEAFISPAHPDAKPLSRRAKEDPLSVIADHSYWYLGYAIPDEETGLAFLDHYREQANARVSLLSDIELGSHPVFRLRQGLVQFRIEGKLPNDRLMRYIGGKPAPVSQANAIAELNKLAVLNPLSSSRAAHASSFAIPQSTIPVMIERPGLHENGANVLFYDGHVEFVQYPGPFPMTQKFINALESLDELKTAGSSNQRMESDFAAHPRTVRPYTSKGFLMCRTARRLASHFA